MAINFTDFSRAPILEKPKLDLFEDVLKGYKMSQEPAKMREEQSARELANKMKNIDLEHKPTENELNDQQKILANAMQKKALENYDSKLDLENRYKESMITKNNQGPAFKDALTGLFRARDSLDPSDPDYKFKKDAINGRINKLSQQVGQTAGAQPGEGIKINLPEGKEGYIPGLGKLKTGWQNVTDVDGNVIGVNVPMTDKDITQWKAKEKFDVIYPFLNSSLAEYSGQDSWNRFSQDARNYNRDPEAKSRIDNYFAAKQLLSIGTTTENARIGGHATNVQLKELKNTLDKSEVHKRLEQGSGFVLPPKYAKNSGDIFKSYLDKVEKTAKTNIPAYEFRALNPGKNESAPQENQANPENNEEPKIIGTQNGFTTIRHGNKTLRIPEQLVDRYMEENSKPAFGGQYG